jgi:capsular polysaccharide biosynthesis protein
LGFEVIAAGPEFFSDMDRVAATVNSCDVLAGVHGAGLTNMVFLPHNATVVQIIPYGKMTYPCRHTYGDPVAPMGLRYVEYEATAEETTLKTSTPRTTSCSPTRTPSPAGVRRGLELVHQRPGYHPGH